MDEPFDDLARRFAAAPMSRRRALVLMVSAALGAAVGLTPRRATASHCGTERVCEIRNGTKACWRPGGKDAKPSEDCKCAEGSPGQGEGCIDARPHCGSSTNPCKGGVPPECKCEN